MPRKKPSEAELIAARVAKKRAAVMNIYRMEPRAFDGDWWVFLVVTIGCVHIQIPMAHVTNENLADGYASRMGGNMIDAILDYQTAREQENQEGEERT